MDETVAENSVSQEVAPPELVENVQEIAENVQQQQVQEDAQERNWRAMRQRQSDLERQLKEREEMLSRLLTNAVPPQKQPVEEELSDEEYSTYAGVKSVAKKHVQPLEQKIEQLEAKLRYKELLDKYKDFEDIVNADTLSLLEQEDPELAQTIAELKDPVKMGIQSYKYIKALNLTSKVPNARRVREAEKKIEKSEKAIQSPLAYDKRPMAQAFRETEAEKKQLYEEMLGYASKAGHGY